MTLLTEVAMDSGTPAAEFAVVLGESARLDGAFMMLYHDAQK